MTVVGVALGYVAQEWRRVQERKAVMQWIDERASDPSNNSETLVTIEADEATWLAYQLGDRTNFAYAATIDLSPADQARIAAAYPEARFEPNPNP